ncbi:MAG: hypothetical protein ABSB55_08845 [Acidimicrobiales bacterium]
MRRSAPVRATSAQERRLDRWRTARRTISVALTPWAFAFFRSRPGSAAYHACYDIGIGFFVVCIAGVIATRPLDSDGTARPADEQPDPPRSADTREAARPIDSDERARWAETTLRALAAISPTGDDHDGPDIAVLRVDATGVEVLLHAPCPVAPAPFRPSAGGLVWSLDSSVELEDLIELGRGVRLSPDAEPAPLVEIGSDEEGSYFARDVGIVTLRLGDEGPGELHDELPSFGSGDRQARSTGLFGAPLVVVERGEHVLLEPYGIPLPVSSESPLPPPPEPPAQAPSDPVPHPEPEAKGVGTEDVEALAPDGDDVPAKAERSARAPVVPAGPVEVRILREVPDLVGELHEEPTAGAVEFVAYLALHGYRAAPSRLKETLGTPRSQSSRSGKSVWTAAGAARRAIGPDLVPAASGNQLYLLSKEVSCDWTRFQALAGIARSAASDPERRRGALVGALELVDGVPGLASRRFTWLDSEGVLSNIAFAVANAARELANLEAEGGSEELTRWAIAKARPLLPDLGELEHQEPKLAGTRRRTPSRR